MAAHLAGALAANTTLPVIGIPIKSAGLGGMDAFSPPCRCLPASRSHGGHRRRCQRALLAVEILAVVDEALAAALDNKRREGAEKALRAAAELTSAPGLKPRIADGKERSDRRHGPFAFRQLRGCRCGHYSRL
jgi:5-(carboxyamino)imidazole ribonucleotide mutase